MTPERPRRILPVIIISQFFGTSLWFASNAILPDLQRANGLAGDVVGLTTSAVQFGFILGTLSFALFSLPDRVSPRKLFAVSSIAGALCNLALLFPAGGLTGLIILRFLTGVGLAGIYPVGMKIAAGWFRKGLGNALGMLVGALVLGTSFPHFLKSTGGHIPWQMVILFVSAGAALGGLLMVAFVKDGPYAVAGPKFELGSLPSVFRSKELRSAAFGYFGHMWELYTFYAFLPFILLAYRSAEPGGSFDISFWSFAVIAAGCVGCAGGGIVSSRAGSARVAWVQLFLSGLCCLCSPLFFHLPEGAFLGLMLVWGIVVVGDSPQFSALTARYAPPQLVGSALTVVTSIGFAITIVSIEVTTAFTHVVSPVYLFTFLAAGPAIGLLSSWQLARSGNR